MDENKNPNRRVMIRDLLGTLFVLAGAGKNVVIIINHLQIGTPRDDGYDGDAGGETGEKWRDE